MSLSHDSLNKLQNELQSKNSIVEIIKDLKAQNKFKKNKVIRLLIFFIFATLITALTLIHNNFSTMFLWILESSINMCASLLGLLIAGFSIIISSLSNNSLYCIILSYDKKSKGKTSKFKQTILYCIEPLIWFTILLIIALVFKYLYYSIPNISEYSIKIVLKSISLFTIIILMLESLCSLEIFVLNVYNLIVMYANWEVLDRATKSKIDQNPDMGIEKIIENLENDLNNSSNE